VVEGVAGEGWEVGGGWTDGAAARLVSVAVVKGGSKGGEGRRSRGRRSTAEAGGGALLSALCDWMKSNRRER